MGNPDAILEARGVACSRAADAGRAASVNDVTLAIAAKSLTLLAGDGGENLLLRLLGLLEPPDAGGIFYRGIATGKLAEEERAELRNHRYGFVFAEPYLLPSFSVVENVAMPLFKISAVDAAEARKRTEAMLEFTGMENLGSAMIGALTHARQQRVSLARALVNQPEILIVENADAGLDDDEALSFGELIRRANLAFGITIILTVSGSRPPKFAGRVIELSGGRIARDAQGGIESGGASA